MKVQEGRSTWWQLIGRLYVRDGGTVEANTLFTGHMIIVGM